ncbi:MAG: 3-deoxy-7-phosphoheptulonate synthase [Deltaproteobacteria bacterium]|nr:3-deoxy-7-phosphoheptulonate synthase [Deltaproteobacteria bacterium]MBW2361962.1 3-deoxy-7-phosphoheptulonate synthase [Deltaproteobacteria bacterium]
MIIVLKADTEASSPEVRRLIAQAESYPDVHTELHRIQGATRSVTEVYLLGHTGVIPTEPFEEHACVEKVVRVTEKYRAIGRHAGGVDAVGFEYNGVRISQETLHVVPGLCAVDNRENVDQMFAALAGHGLQTARAGAYKPRTSPYDFQGLGQECLPWVFERAGHHGIRIVAMEVTHEAHVEQIQRALEASGNATGVLLQIGTRNAQNFELLKAVGQQTELPVLFKRGMGITLEESINACEYVASGGNRRIIFCLRGMKTNLGDPHRNFVDFSHVPVVKRLTRLPVCVDPSHSVGSRALAPDGLMDVYHVTAQGIIAGANLVLVDFHPHPEEALCDGPQALLMEELPHFLEDVAIVRRAYEDRLARAKQDD